MMNGAAIVNTSKKHSTVDVSGGLSPVGTTTTGNRNHNGQESRLGGCYYHSCLPKLQEPPTTIYRYPPYSPTVTVGP